MRKEKRFESATKKTLKRIEAIAFSGNYIITLTAPAALSFIPIALTRIPMPNQRKFKKGDFVLIRAWLPFDYELGKIIKFDEEKNMYQMFYYDEIDDPASLVFWTYMKEDDLVLAEEVLRRPYSDMFINEDIEFSEETYANCYNAYYFLAKKVYDGEISKAEYYDAVDRLWAKGSA